MGKCEIEEDELILTAVILPAIAFHSFDFFIPSQVNHEGDDADYISA
jgi:hypothetical protein